MSSYPWPTVGRPECLTPPECRMVRDRGGARGVDDAWPDPAAGARLGIDPWPAAQRRSRLDAAASLRTRDDHGDEFAIPADILDRGLAYLRATVSGRMGPMEEEYERLRGERSLPSASEDLATQINEMIAAMRPCDGSWPVFMTNSD